jgi:peptidoglycan lytic transglycosylase
MSLSIRSSLFVCIALCPLLVPQPAGAFAPTRHDGQTGDTEFGKASWYGYENGRRTASGERFDTDDLTAAHRHLPFGTIVRVTNRENGRSVEVRINDRGPWCGGGRIIDVSSAAADVLRMKKAGIVRVEIEVVRLGSPARLPLAQASAP